MSPTRRQLLQGIAALALTPSKGLAPVASYTCTWDMVPPDASEWRELRLADMPPGWDVYDDLDLELMALNQATGLWREEEYHTMVPIGGWALAGWGDSGWVVTKGT